jgi:hypothetical protein
MEDSIERKSEDIRALISAFPCPDTRIHLVNLFLRHPAVVVGVGARVRLSQTAAVALDKKRWIGMVWDSRLVQTKEVSTRINRHELPERRRGRERATIQGREIAREIENEKRAEKEGSIQAVVGMGLPGTALLIIPSRLVRRLVKGKVAVDGRKTLQRQGLAVRL